MSTCFPVPSQPVWCPYSAYDQSSGFCRPDEDRNAMERLTLASLQHLPTAVLFVVDLTEGCGTSVGDQHAIR